MELGLIRSNHNEFGSPILFFRKAYTSLTLDIDCRRLIYEVRRKDAYPNPRVVDNSR
jgi:hypothetical protein